MSASRSKPRHGASEAGGPLRKRTRSAPRGEQDSLQHDEDGNRMENVSNGGISDSTVWTNDGTMQLANEDSQSLLFSRKPMGATSGDSSGRPHNVQQTHLFKLDGPKQKIFLSHSGAQKDFVEQLCVDLEKHAYFFPFFDQRHHSLPKGKDFAPLIIEAARLCHVAVIVLSEEFLSSKWPMLELAEFYSAQQQCGGRGEKLHMLPLFFKLSIEDVKDKDRWMPMWKQHASKDERVDVTKWSAAVKALCKSTGLRFDKDAMNNEVAYRKLVVSSIFKLSPPDLLYGSSKRMVAFDRLCKDTLSLFVEDTTIGANVLGIYGMAGVGKTTLSKAMCDYLNGEYLGRVCYVDLDREQRAWRQEEILKALCGFERNVLDGIGMDIDKGETLMRLHMWREPVLLVLDNLTNYARVEEAREYLNAGFHPKSKIILMAKSKEVLRYLLPSIECIKSMPNLHPDEAEELFLKHAAPMKSIVELTNDERRIVEICTRKCWFESEEGGSYHPLALKALADFFCRLGKAKGDQLLVCKDHLDKGMVSMRDAWSSANGLYDILNMQFSTFEYDWKLFFLDIAYVMEQLWYPWETIARLDDLVEFFSRLYHGRRTEVEIKQQMEDLQNSGMITVQDNLNDQYVHVPDLYKEFADWYVSEHYVKGLTKVSGVFQTMGTSLRGGASSSSRKWDDLVRLRIVDITPANYRLLEGKAMQEMSNLVVLQIYDCLEITKLNLKGLDLLRHLELVKLTNLKTMLLPGNTSTDGYSGIYDSLQYVKLEGLDNLCDLPDFRSCTSLHSFKLRYCRGLTNLGVLECPQLKELNIWGLFEGQYNFDEEYKFEGLPNLEALHSLEMFHIETMLGDGLHWNEVTKAEYAKEKKMVIRRNGYFGELHHKLHTACLKKWKYVDYWNRFGNLYSDCIYED